MTAPVLHVPTHPLDDDVRRTLLEAWTAGLGRAEAEVRGRLDRVVLTASEGAGGACLGVVTAEAANVAVVARRRFWVLDTDVRGDEPALVQVLRAGATDRLAAGFDPEARGVPIGACLLVADRAELEHRPQAVWEDGGRRWLYAGYASDGRQVRITYFDGARVGVERPR